MIRLSLFVIFFIFFNFKNIFAKKETTKSNIEYNAYFSFNLNHFIKSRDNNFLLEYKENSTAIFATKINGEDGNLLNYKNDLGSSVGLFLIWENNFLFGILNEKSDLKIKDNENKKIFILEDNIKKELTKLDITNDIDSQNYTLLFPIGINHKISDKIRAQFAFAPGINFAEIKNIKRKIDPTFSIISGIDFKITKNCYLTARYTLSPFAKDSYQAKNFETSISGELSKEIKSIIKKEIKKDLKNDNTKAYVMEIDTSNTIKVDENNIRKRKEYYIAKEAPGIKIEDIEYDTSTTNISIKVPVKSVVFSLKNEPNKKFALSLKKGVKPMYIFSPGGCFDFNAFKYTREYKDSKIEKKKINIDKKLLDNGINKDEYSYIVANLKPEDNKKYFLYDPLTSRRKIQDPYHIDLYNTKFDQENINLKSIGDILIPNLWKHTFSLGLIFIF